MIAKGEKVTEFEVKLRSYLKINNLFTCSCGTNALILSLLGLNIKKNNEVILSTYVCSDVLRAVQFCGAKPVLCDIGPHWNVSTETVSEKISSKTKAIILAHVYGIPINTKKFLDFEIPIIEDCCQSFGAEIENKKIGTIGTIGVFSFHATKCLTSGEGGAIASNDDTLIKKIKKINSSSNIFSRMTDIQAVLGNSQLQRYPEFLEIRKKIADMYYSEIPKELTYKMQTIRNQSMYFRFLLNTRHTLKFSKIRRLYQDKNIAIRRGVDKLLHRTYKKGINSGFPNANNCFDTTLSIPIYPSLSEKNIRKIIEVTNNLHEKGILI